MWNEKRSIILSKLLLLIFAAITIIAVIFSGSIAAALESNYESLGLMNIRLLRYFTYAMAVPILMSLYYLNKLLDNIREDLIFVRENVVIIRRISWLMALAGMVFVVASVANYYLLLPALVAFFMFLILRILKNVFERAVAMKDEHDFTI